MKRVLAVLIALAMLFSFAACGNNNAQTEATEAEDTREAYENLQLSLGTGLPEITMWGIYYLNEISDGFAAEGMVASYYTDPASEPDYDFYQWEKGDQTLADIAVTQFTKHAGVQSVSDANKFNSWDGSEVNDYYHYATFCEYEGKNYIVQTYFFEAEDSFVAVDRWNETGEVETSVGNFVIMLPALYREAKYADEVPEELVAAYYDADEMLPLVYIYHDKSDASTDEFMAELCKDYTVTTSNRLTYTADDGTTYPGGFFRFTETEDDEVYSEATYFIDLGSEKLRINFLCFGENTSAEMSVPALYQAIKLK